MAQLGIGRIFQMANALRSQTRSIYHLTANHETIPERIQRYECLFCRRETDGWDIRQAMNDMAGMDMVPDPRIIISALYACRRINEYALAIRFLETIRLKCEACESLHKIYPYILQEIGPTLDELGIDTPEALNYDKPELFLPDSDDYIVDKQ
ncbi:hypothetical protein RN001_001391 [Aquatica leii]|uniref:Cytochrome c oxidase subunit 5A, mitochondrial n=1 Tax=Aquatica leii TaxID=1421715 RepID=A0AAN7SSM4_9COLE|nr:hypothetical protein RN001_001391 [Aquatica leii]